MEAAQLFSSREFSGQNNKGNHFEHKNKTKMNEEPTLGDIVFPENKVCCHWRSWHGASPSILRRRSCRCWTRTASSCRRTTVEFGHEVCSVADWLLDQSGLQPGDRVGLVFLPCAEFVVAKLQPRVRAGAMPPRRPRRRRSRRHVFDAVRRRDRPPDHAAPLRRRRA